MGAGWVPPQSSASASASLLARFRPILSNALSVVRRGQPQVIWTPPRLGGGNHLYLWMGAWAARARGEIRFVLKQPGMDVWISHFPALRELTIDVNQVKFTMDRANLWFHDFDEFGIDTLDAFTSEVLLNSDQFQERLKTARKDTTPETLTINVRRGDYYSNDAFRKRYAMDHEHLMDLVSEHVLREGSGVKQSDRSILAVSDDPEWCANYLPDLLRSSRLSVAPRTDMFDDLAHLAVADSLVLSNSTFSYWGGYLNDVVQGANEGSRSRVWAPTFHDREGRSPRSGLLSPRWNLLENHSHEASRIVS